VTDSIGQNVAGSAEGVRSLEQSLATCESSIRTAQAENNRILRQLTTLDALIAWLKLTKTARRIVDQTIIWRPGAVFIVSTLLGGFAFAVFRSPIFGGLVGILAMVAIVLMMMYPSDSKVGESIGKCDSSRSELKVKRDVSKALCHELTSKSQNLNDQFKNARIQWERAQLLASDDYRRKKLLSENWKAMRSVEFEEFLERVFSELGYTVDTTKITGDQGVDLIVAHRVKRIAIQVKGYLNSVSNSAIQEAHTGMTHYSCHASAVITNSRFTPSATELANSVRCVLIGEDQLPDLIMGKIDLWSMCFGGNN
jgi:hypothetical protein